MHASAAESGLSPAVIFRRQASPLNNAPRRPNQFRPSAMTPNDVTSLGHEITALLRLIETVFGVCAARSLAGRKVLP